MKKTKIVLFFILLLAAFLRFYHLNDLPPGFHVDEVAVGYNAYSLMKIGKDMNGKLLPLHINSFGDFRPAGYFYATIPAIKIFGLNEFTVRFPSALVGVLAVWLTFLLTRQLFKDESISLLAAFLLAISPWHIILSRASSEGAVALFLIMVGVYFLIRLFGSKKIRLGLILAFLPLLASYFFYHTPRLFVPLLISGVVFFNWPKIKTKQLKKIIILLLIACFLISILLLLLGPGAGRFKQVSIFNNPGVQLRLDEQIREEDSGINIFLVRLFHNKLVNYGLEIISNYGKYFSIDFLFIKGGLPMRYFVPETGLLHLIEFPFILLGAFLILKKKRGLAYLPLYWLAIGPVASSLTFEDIPNIHRALFMLPSFQILAAVGFYESLDFLKKKSHLKRLLIFVSVLALFFNLNYFWHQYSVHQRVYRPWYRNYGFRELISEINRVLPDYERVILTKAHDDPYIYILFYNQYDPEVYYQYHSSRGQDRWGFEKYLFFPENCPSYIKKEVLKDEKTLFVDKGECKRLPYTQVIKTIYREDQTPAFHLLLVDKKLAIDYFEKVENLTEEVEE